MLLSASSTSLPSSCLSSSSCLSVAVSLPPQSIGPHSTLISICWNNSHLQPHWLMHGLQLSKHQRSCFPHCPSFISLLTSYVWLLTSMKARTILVLLHNMSNPNPALKAAGLGNSVERDSMRPLKEDAGCQTPGKHSVNVDF